ncbi:MAG TPA: HD-GYP domain-containing protein, partial [Clostridia bacterium]|nr:HD-GYP domain-containing protein [Clostridia bacterium]
MRKIGIKHAKPGMKLARSIINATGHVLIGRGVVLTHRYIDRLQDKGVYHLYIEDDISEGIEIEDIVSDRTRNYAQVVIKDVMDDIVWQNKLNRVPEITKIVNNIVDELLDNDDILVNIKDIRMIDDYTFGHCTNVCILSIITGIELGYNELRLRDLGVGALLHDIGKMRIPKHILQKPGQLTSEEYEQIKQHTVFGFEILRNCDDIRKPAANAALGHHERFDGSGYPRGLTGKDTHEFAKVIAIADVYDAMTSDRVYRTGMEPNEAARYLTSMGDTLFDNELVNTFMKSIAIYPVGSSVILNTGEKGLVSKTHSDHPNKPTVRIIYNPQGDKYNSFKEVNLAMNPELTIMR